jgi:hypothetical protein
MPRFRFDLILVNALTAVIAIGPSVVLGQGYRGCADDSGDAPASYGSTANCNSGVGMWETYMGACVDQDGGDLASPDALGDDTDFGGAGGGTCDVAGDDEDGVTFDSLIVPGANADLTVTCAGPNGFCALSAWVDFNANGLFTDSGERVFNDVSLNPGPNALVIAVPANATVGTTFARFRVCESGGIPSCALPTGYVQADGEVEDHAVTIVGASDPLIFTDGFESGDTSAWSSTVGD